MVEGLRDIDLLSGYPQAISRALHSMLYARRWTLGYLDGITDDVVDHRPSGHQHSIGTLLCHIAAFEMDWLFSDIRGEPFPAEVQDLIPYEQPYMEDRTYTPVTGETLLDHLDRLARVREIFLDAFRGMTVEDFREPRRHETYATPEWIVHHLAQHEGEHRGQIWEARVAAEKELGRSN